MNKQELIELIQSLPDGIEVFVAKEGQFDDLDIRIFKVPKEKKFYDWYFGM